MKNYLFILGSIACLNSYSQGAEWPVLKHYEGKFIDKIAMPVGGIGTGNISIAGNGQWKDVEIMNKPGIGFNGSIYPKLAPCFLVFTEDAQHVKKTKSLSGPIPVSQFQGMQGSEAPNNGFPRFRSVSFDAAYPFAVVNLDDDAMPVSARVKTFGNPEDADTDSSSDPRTRIFISATGSEKRNP